MRIRSSACGVVVAVIAARVLPPRDTTQRAPVLASVDQRAQGQNGSDSAASGADLHARSSSQVGGRARRLGQRVSAFDLGEFGTVEGLGELWRRIAGHGEQR